MNFKEWAMGVVLKHGWKHARFIAKSNQFDRHGGFHKSTRFFTNALTWIEGNAPAGELEEGEQQNAHSG